jgi:putative ABC transport system permease protein
VTLKVVGIDALSVAAVAPALLPRPADGVDRLASLDPDAVFLNTAAAQRLDLKAGDTLRVQRGLATVSLRVAGHISAGGTALAVVDIAGAQMHFGFESRLTRIDLRLVAGAQAESFAAQLPAGWAIGAPEDAA